MIRQWDDFVAPRILSQCQIENAQGMLTVHDPYFPSVYFRPEALYVRLDLHTHALQI